MYFMIFCIFAQLLLFQKSEDRRRYSGVCAEICLLECSFFATHERKGCVICPLCLINA
jgi:hypothetical protein